MDFKVASDTEIGILQSIVGITRKMDNSLRGGNTIAVGLLGSNTVDVGVLDGNIVDVGVHIPEVNRVKTPTPEVNRIIRIPQVLNANDVGVVGVTQHSYKPCGKGEQCAKWYYPDDGSMMELHYTCSCGYAKADGKSCHNLSKNNVLVFNIWIMANNFTSLTPITFRVVSSNGACQLCVCKVMCLVPMSDPQAKCCCDVQFDVGS